MISNHRASKFIAALQSTISPLSSPGVRIATVHEDAQSALKLAVRLHDYREYLSQARAFKVKSSGANGEAGYGIDAEVLVHGRQALADVRGFTSASLRMVRSLHRVGALAPQLAAWRSAIQQSGGSVSIVEEWDRLSSLAEVKQGFAEIGLSPGLLGAIDHSIRQANVEVTLSPSHLVINSTADGKRVTGKVSTAARPAMPANVLDLLVRGRFERMVDALEGGEATFLEGVGIADLQQVGVPEVLLLDVLETHREVVRHVRKLEDTGLATYSGGGPGAIIFGIVVVLFSAELILDGIYCYDGPHREENKLICGLSKLLWFIGFALAAIFLNGDPNSQPQSLSRMGGPVTHGILRDLSTRTT